MSDYISPYILLSEYQCHCGNCHGLPPMLNTLVDMNDMPTIYSDFFDDFSIIRNAWGKAIPISSGYRCPAYNASIGGSLLSAHCFGIALDLNILPAEVEDLDRVIEEVAPHLRRGKYTQAGSFIHVDCGHEIYPRPKETFIEGYKWNG